MMNKLLNPKWKSLSNEEKLICFDFIAETFIHPELEISNVRIKNFELGGIKNKTIEFNLLDESFLFVPGQKNVILGWDNGTNLYPMSELLEKTETKNVPNRHFSREAIDRFINENTSNVRKVDIPPMIVGKYAYPASSTYIGMLDGVSGEFHGAVELFAPYEKEIRRQLFPELSLEESFSYESPKKLFSDGKFFLEYLEQEEVYRVFLHNAANFKENLSRIQEWNLSFLSADEWEYVNGSGARRLFRWGSEWSDCSKANAVNMFGLYFETDKARFELISDKGKLKLGGDVRNTHQKFQTMLPLSTYFEPHGTIQEKEILSPEKYMYRKVIKLV
ncbi:hypothetical protein SAMN02745116_01214 [Pilibacter termitis]|uniref:DUF7278 domain-containing protein n=1 Tax=Pilibacter termitis TaxID=263852 RepID=A0A1T4MUF0_9ENTE|nr:hypothetical protein [Pilibacter termitis]SJZ70268.1 hypothetical protein SAMN02745116_01214 [Pilibacter termitis]